MESGQSDLAEPIDSIDSAEEGDAKENSGLDDSDDTAQVDELPPVAASEPIAIPSESSEEDAGLSFTPGWNRGEDGSWSWYDEGATESRKGWLVTDQALDGSGSGLQRYWLDPLTGTLAIGRLIRPEEGTGYWAYATEYGWVVRGTHRVEADDRTHIYLADNDGRLEETGWVVTGDYTGGTLERYYVDPADHAVKVGYSEEGGYAHYSTSDGYVVRGGKELSGKKYFADNDGRLSVREWVVTGDFNNGALQRYWAGNDGVIVTNKLLTPEEHGVDYFAYATETGSVARGKTSVGDKFYLADNEGRLEDAGWLVTDKYDGGYQRYWIDEDAHAAIVGFSKDGYAHYTTNNGYVGRGGIIGGNGVKYYADNDGRLTETGWVVTGDFANGALQRYWFKDFTVARNTLITPDQGAGYYAYADENGTILRGKLKFQKDGERGVYLADNDGRFIEVANAGWAVTGLYDGGALNRYWIAESAKGFFYALTGFFEAKLSPTDANTSLFFGDESAGYVVRGKKKTSSGYLLADNDGRLEVASGNGGFIVSDKYDGGLQRYYLKLIDGAYYAQTGHIQDGGDHYYGVDAGYILRGKLRMGSGMLLADNDGKLAWDEGWLVTDKYDGEGNYQRYRIDGAPGNGLMGAHLGLFVLDGNRYYGREDQGYVVRDYYVPYGTTTIYYGNNDGVLQEHGWFGAAGENAWRRIWYKASSTRYLIALDVEGCYTYIFEGSAGNWKPLKIMRCSTGSTQYHGGEGTPRGEWSIGGNADYNWNESGDYTPGGYRTTYWAINDVRYFTGFLLNLGFHSTVGWEGGYSDPSQLGKRISHGCIRLAEMDAKWIYDNCLPGTKVITY